LTIHIALNQALPPRGALTSTRDPHTTIAPRGPGIGWRDRAGAGPEPASRCAAIGQLRKSGRGPAV